MTNGMERLTMDAEKKGVTQVSPLGKTTREKMSREYKSEYVPVADGHAVGFCRTLTMDCVGLVVRG